MIGDLLVNDEGKTELKYESYNLTFDVSVPENSWLYLQKFLNEKQYLPLIDYICEITSDRVVNFSFEECITGTISYCAIVDNKHLDSKFIFLAELDLIKLQINIIELEGFERDKITDEALDIMIKAKKEKNNIL